MTAFPSAVWRQNLARAAIGLALAFCLGWVWRWIGPHPPRAEGDRVVIRFWNGFTGPDGRTILRIVKQFNREHPDVQVLMQRMDWGTYYNKLFVAGLGDRAPDVFVSHASYLPRFVRAGLLRPLADQVEGDPSLEITDFDSNVWSAILFEGVPYGLPLDIHLFGMYYNRALFREAGLVDADGEPIVPRSREQFLDTLRALTRDLDEDGVIDQWGFVLTWMRVNAASLMPQFGGDFLSADLQRCTLADPRNARALQAYVDLVEPERVAPSPENIDAWIGFRQGRVGIAFEGIWMLSDLRKQTDLEVGAAPLPVLGETPGTWADAHVLCLPRGLEGRALDAAWQFVRYLSDHGLDWADAGPIPPRKSLRNTPRFQGMAEQRAFAEQIPYARFYPRAPYCLEMLAEFDVAVEQVFRGSATPEAALQTATEKVEEIIARDRAAWESAP